MRNLFLMLLMTSATAVSANKMAVVVHTSDRVVVDYVCTDRLNRGQNNAVRHVVQATGRFDWHVSNGKAPYHIVEQERDDAGNVCITVMDAVGNMATGCGIIAERRVVASVNCPQYFQDDSPCALPLKAMHKAAPTKYLQADLREASPVRKPIERKPEISPRTTPPTRTVGRRTPVSKVGRTAPVVKTSGR